MSTAEIKKQVEYYFGDTNLARDEFFRDMIKSGKDGYIEIGAILKCNKIKHLGVNKASQVVAALKGSQAVEVSKDGLKIRRTGNASLPDKVDTPVKKRDAKAEEKKAATTNGNSKEEEVKEAEPVQRDEQGRIIFCLADFENTLIVHYKTEDKDEEADKDYKVSWKDLESYIKEHLDQIKVVYSRADKYEGDLAISSHKLNKDQYKQLIALKNVKVGTKNFCFEETHGEELKEFWQKQGGHFQYCIAPKLRLARKNQRKVQELKREEKAKRQKQSFTIAGVYYMDINKVKSKSRAILNLKKDGETLE